MNHTSMSLPTTSVITDQLSPESASPLSTSSQVKAYIGIDNGFTGAIACLFPDDSVLFQPVSVLDLGKEKLLDIRSQQAVLHEILAAANRAGVGVMAVYEQCQPNPLFGPKNNYTNGKNGEFWRLLLSLEEIPFQWVNPQQWQKHLFRGIRGSDTKAMAELVRTQRLPRLSGNNLSRTKMVGVNDAVCIALWARDNLK